VAANHCRLCFSRRRFVQSAGWAGFGLLAGCGRLPGQAQAPAKTYRMGYLTPTSALIDAPRFAGLERGLQDLGWIAGQNLTVERRVADGQVERLPDLAAELVQLQPDVLVGFADEAIRAMKRATSAVPIVFAGHADPVGTGVVASLAHPGANVTGVSTMAPELAGKRLELLKQAVPTATRVGTIFNDTRQAMARENGETLVAAEALGIELAPLGVRSPADFDQAYQAGMSSHLDAIVVILDPLVSDNRDRLVELSTKTGLPTISGDAAFAAAGGLMSYGANLPRQAARAAYYVDRILKGAKPADLPVEQPMLFDFVINLQTAQALGLTIPQPEQLPATEILQKADRLRRFEQWWLHCEISRASPRRVLRQPQHQVPVRQAVLPQEQLRGLEWRLEQPCLADLS
jgi:putative ABC transport system substrate-binding protein